MQNSVIVPHYCSFQQRRPFLTNTEYISLTLPLKHLSQSMRKQYLANTVKPNLCSHSKEDPKNLFSRQIIT